jgi:hypothetical protein
MINATSNTRAMTNANAAGCFIAPVRIANLSEFTANPRLLMYDTSRNEIGYSTASTNQSKTFVIDHPVDKEKYLVHACLEGPEGGVYYRGTSEITNNEYVEIELPHYVSHIANDFTILTTPIYSETNSLNKPLRSTTVKNNKFKVYGENTKFYWLVEGKRQNIEVEPLKIKTRIQGSGPYKWIG